jgi:hypothetical protein
MNLQAAPDCRCTCTGAAERAVAQFEKGVLLGGRVRLLEQQNRSRSSNNNRSRERGEHQQQGGPVDGWMGCAGTTLSFW